MGNNDPSIVFVVESEMTKYGGTERWLRDFINVNHMHFKKIGIMKFENNNPNSENTLQHIVEGTSIEILNIREVNSLALSKAIKSVFGQKFYDYFAYQFLIYLYNFHLRKQLKPFNIAYLTSYNLIFAVKLLKHSIKLVYGSHNNDFSSLKFRSSVSLGTIHARISLVMIDMVHFISDDSIQNLRIKKRTISISNGIDTDSFHPIYKKRNEDVTKILFVGRLEYYKGVIIALDAFKKLPENKYHLTICGDGSLKEYILENKPKNSEFIPNAADKLLQEIYQNNDILIFPSSTETFGLVVAEALASGLYCIVSEAIKPKFEEFMDINVLSYCSRNSESFTETILKITDKLPDYDKKIEAFNLIKKNYSIYSLYPNIAGEILKA